MEFFAAVATELGWGDVLKWSPVAILVMAARWVGDLGKFAVALLWRRKSGEKENVCVVQPLDLERLRDVKKVVCEKADGELLSHFPRRQVREEHAGQREDHAQQLLVTRESVGIQRQVVASQRELVLAIQELRKDLA